MVTRAKKKASPTILKVQENKEDALGKIAQDAEGASANEDESECELHISHDEEDR